MNLHCFVWTTAINVDIPDNAKFDLEYVWTYEAGVKTDWLDRRLILNAAVFISKADDLQAMRFDPATMAQSFQNAAKATLQGIEVELLARPMERLDIIGSFGLLDTEFDDKQKCREE